jgi:hypothetical protein
LAFIIVITLNTLLPHIALIAIAFPADEKVSVIEIIAAGISCIPFISVMSVTFFTFIFYGTFRAIFIFFVIVIVTIINSEMPKETQTGGTRETIMTIPGNLYSAS